MNDPTPAQALTDALTALAGAGPLVDLHPAHLMRGIAVTEDNIAALADVLPEGTLAPYSTPTVGYRAHDGYRAEVEPGDVVVPLAGGGWAAIYRSELGTLWTATPAATDGEAVL